ncbi:MAG: hypothetical protein DMG18_14370 [Acidobacteria bacterium]|nr:MAG: hypothetical protein DMG18_14370 [Acidobacteriota bacterium]
MTVQPPSKKRIAKAAVAALIIAAALLVTAVLPAEYGIDPLGTAKLLRLTDLAKTPRSPTGPLHLVPNRSRTTRRPPLFPYWNPRLTGVRPP